MPYYHWRGITLQGQLQRGKQHARSQEELELFLLKRDIALLYSKSAYYPLRQRAVSVSQIIVFFKQLSTLLSAGVLVPQALSIVQEQIDHPQFQDILSTISQAVQHGMSLSQALQLYPTIFYPIAVQMVAVGQEAGMLSSSLMMLADYLEVQANVRKQLKSAALLPMVTFAFFLIISAVIVVGIVPRFASLFASFNHELPYVTQQLIMVSNCVTSWYMLVMVPCGGIIILLIMRLCKSARIGLKLDSLYLTLPFVGPLIRYKNSMFFLQALSLSVANNVSLPKALRLAWSTITNSAFKEKLNYLEQEVASGVPLSEAMAQHSSHIFEADVLAMISVGENSGTVAAMAQKAANAYQERMHNLITLYTTFFQPLLLMILGVLIVLLIMAVYLPVLQLSHIIY